MTTHTLVLLRHAKAARPDGVADRDRPLTARGHADAAVAGAWLSSQGFWPDLVLCSPARRTRETWHGIRVALGGTAGATNVVFDPTLYEAGARDALELLRTTGSEVKVLLVVGHNPTMSTLSTLLDPDSEINEGLRTATLAVHRVDGGWQDCAPRHAPLIALHTARAE